MGLRTSLRTKSDSRKHSTKQFHERKSLRFKTKKIRDGDVDSTGDMPGVSIRDLEQILGKHGLPTSRSGVHLNELQLHGFLEKARAVFMAKVNKVPVGRPDFYAPQIAAILDTSQVEIRGSERK